MGSLRIIAGRWGGRRLSSPRGRDVRPTSDRVREAWMSILTPQLQDARVLDLFAGTGALGLEALSRGAAHVTFVENDRRIVRCLKENIQALEAEPLTRIVTEDVFEYIDRLDAEAHDLALADPPYERGYAARLLERFVDQPFARLLSLEHSASEQVHLPSDGQERRYGDTILSFVPAGDLEDSP